MTITDILQSQACQLGKMPKVLTEDGHIGQVTVIKNHKGVVGVEIVISSLPEWKGVRWYWQSDETDKRRKYMRDLQFAPPDESSVCCSKCGGDTFIIDAGRIGAINDYKIDGNSPTGNIKYAKCKHCGHQLPNPVVLNDNIVKITFYTKKPNNEGNQG